MYIYMIYVVEIGMQVLGYEIHGLEPNLNLDLD